MKKSELEAIKASTAVNYLYEFESVGRRIHVIEFKIIGTHSSILLGNPKVNFARDLMEEEKKIFHGNTIFFPADALPADELDSKHKFNLPNFKYTIELESEPLDDKYHGSALKVVYFSNQSDLNIKCLVELFQNSLNWNNNANDFLF